MHTPTIHDMVEFIWINKGNTFKDYSTKDQIAIEIARAIKENSMFYATNSDNKLIGMILADINHEKKIVFVTENLAMSLATLRLFATKAKATWPDYNLRWMKRNILKFHSTKKVYRKLALS